MAKQQLRQEMQANRLSLSDNFHQEASTAITQRVCCLKEFIKAKKIAAYCPTLGEASPLGVIHEALSNKKQVFLPKLKTNDHLTFHPCDTNTKLIRNKYKILEPENTEQMPIEDLDLILVPLVAFDENCNRLGMGKGCYDKTIGTAGKKPILVGIAYELQKVDNLPTEEHDIVLDAVITEKAVYQK